MSFCLRINCRNKFNIKINKNISNNELISRPAVTNVLIMLNGMSKENGGTRIVPGSHLFGRHPDKVLDKDIEVISAEGPPGCAIITDGRHGMEQVLILQRIIGLRY